MRGVWRARVVEEVQKEETRKTSGMTVGIFVGRENGDRKARWSKMRDLEGGGGTEDVTRKSRKRAMDKSLSCQNLREGAAQARSILRKDVMGVSQNLRDTIAAAGE